ncbi:MAG TPA: hypothetical protein PLP01_04940 [Phycisphaerae bacterium]|nr:hypothetical protein [Phycisphaerae bacterium]
MLKTLFLEEPLWLCLASGLALLVTIAVWQSRRTRGPLYAMAFWVAFGVGVYVAATLVDTPREKVAKAWVEIRQAIHERQAERLLSYVADDFTHDGQDKEAMRLLVAIAFKTNAPEDVILGNGDLVESDSQVDVTMFVRYKPVERYGWQWQVTFRPSPDGQWRVSEARCLTDERLTLPRVVRKL